MIGLTRLDTPTEHRVDSFATSRDVEDRCPTSVCLYSGDERAGKNLVGGIFDLVDLGFRETLVAREEKSATVSLPLYRGRAKDVP